MKVARSWGASGSGGDADQRHALPRYHPTAPRRTFQKRLDGHELVVIVQQHRRAANRTEACGRTRVRQERGTCAGDDAPSGSPSPAPSCDAHAQLPPPHSTQQHPARASYRSTARPARGGSTGSPSPRGRSTARAVRRPSRRRRARSAPTPRRPSATRGSPGSGPRSPRRAPTSRPPPHTSRRRAP